MKQNAALTRLVLQGFRFQTAKKYLELRRRGMGVDGRDLRTIMRMLPFRRAMDDLFSDIVTTKRALTRHGECFPSQLALSVSKSKQPFVALPDSRKSGALSVDDVVMLLKREGSLEVRDSKHALWGFSSTVSCESGIFSINGTASSKQEVKNFFEGLRSDVVLQKKVYPDEALCSRVNCSMPLLHVCVLNEMGSAPTVVDLRFADHGRPDGSTSFFSETVLSVLPDVMDPRISGVCELALSVARQFPELEYVGVAAVICSDRFSVAQIDTGWELALRLFESDAVRGFARCKMERWRAPGILGQMKLVRKYGKALVAKRKGFLDYMYANWKRGLRDDVLTAPTSISEKLWAHRRGFYSYRIKQYGLSDENYRSMMSDYDYKRLRPINPGYQKWFWDKITMYYILEPFADYLPTYWFRVVPYEGSVCLLPFPAWQEEGVQDEDRFIALLEREGTLVMKPAIGSHGKGFHRLDHRADSGTYLLDGEPYGRSGILECLNSLDREYIVTEYVRMHRDLQKIYSGVTGTVRVMTIAGIGEDCIKVAYFRVGASSTGQTDNIAAGGIVASVDVETGYFGNAELLKEHEFWPCPVHPDTNMPIEGSLPHWEEIKETLRSICQYLSPMEYLGFDIAITDDGFRIIEINTHQDLHKFPSYPQDVKEYLFEKLQAKK